MIIIQIMVSMLDFRDKYEYDIIIMATKQIYTYLTNNLAKTLPVIAQCNAYIQLCTD